jgi:hypothetical protein
MMRYAGEMLWPVRVVRPGGSSGSPGPKAECGHSPLSWSIHSAKALRRCRSWSGIIQSRHSRRALPMKSLAVRVCHCLRRNRLSAAGSARVRNTNATKRVRSAGGAHVVQSTGGDDTVSPPEPWRWQELAVLRRFGVFCGVQRQLARASASCPCRQLGSTPLPRDLGR